MSPRRRRQRRRRRRRRRGQRINERKESDEKKEKDRKEKRREEEQHSDESAAFTWSRLLLFLLMVVVIALLCCAVLCCALRRIAIEITTADSDWQNDRLRSINMDAIPSHPNRRLANTYFQQRSSASTNFMERIKIICSLFFFFSLVASSQTHPRLFH